jgi:hypothetical protein
MTAHANPPQSTPSPTHVHPPRHERPNHSLPTTPPTPQPSWLDHHPIVMGILATLGVLVASAVAVFLWIVGEEKYGFYVGFLVVVFVIINTSQLLAKRKARQKPEV